MARCNTMSHSHDARVHFLSFLSAHKHDTWPYMHVKMSTARYLTTNTLVQKSSSFHHLRVFMCTLCAVVHVRTCIYCVFVLFHLCIFILFMLLFNFVSYVFLSYVYVFLLLCMFSSAYTILIMPTGTLQLPWLRFFLCFFLSCKANARV